MAHVSEMSFTAQEHMMCVSKLSKTALEQKILENVKLEQMVQDRRWQQDAPRRQATD